MAEHRRVDEILGAIADREQIHGLVEPRVPPALKYKKTKQSEVGLPDLHVGRKLVTKHSPNGRIFGDVLGYSLGVVVDFHARGSESYYQEANAIVQVVKVTNSQLSHLLGRLISVNVGDYFMSSLFVPEQAQLSNYKWIEVPDAPRPLAF